MSGTLIPDQKIRYLGLMMMTTYDSDRLPVQAINKRVASLEALRWRNYQVTLLHQASQALSSTLELEEVLAIVLLQVRRLLGAVACSIWLVGAEETEAEGSSGTLVRELICRQASGPCSEILRGWHLAPGQGIAGWVVRSGKSAFVPDTRYDKRHYKGVDERTGRTTRAIFSVPLRIKGEVIGVLQIVDTKVNRFNPTDLAVLESLAAPAAIAIYNARQFAALRQRTLEL